MAAPPSPLIATLANPPSPLIATLATKHSLPDLRIFLKTLQLWNSAAPPKIYIFTDTIVADAIPSIGYEGEIVVNETLDEYSNYTRADMERLPGVGGNLFFQFTLEKIKLLEWVFETETVAVSQGVFFFDADICFLGQLPNVPATATVGLSKHYIRQADESRYGKYNAGFIWIRDPRALEVWRTACGTSRFFEQAALECFDEPEWADAVYSFPIQNNYGWWRLFQGEKSPEELRLGWRIHRAQGHAGLLVQNSPLLSIHTHWITADPTTQMFNSFVSGILRTLSNSHVPAKRLLRILADSSK